MKQERKQDNLRHSQAAKMMMIIGNRLGRTKREPIEKRESESEDNPLPQGNEQNSGVEEGANLYQQDIKSQANSRLHRNLKVKTERVTRGPEGIRKAGENKQKWIMKGKGPLRFSKPGLDPEANDLFVHRYDSVSTC